VITDDAAVGVAFIFGVAYNTLIGWLHRQAWWGKGLVAVEVVVGVLIVLALASLINANKHYVMGAHVLTNGQSAAWIVLRCFVGAGIPMFFGSVYRSVQELA
jgi:hypothetical protein